MGSEGGMGVSTQGEIFKGTVGVDLPFFLLDVGRLSALLPALFAGAGVAAPLLFAELRAEGLFGVSGSFPLQLPRVFRLPTTPLGVVAALVAADAICELRFLVMRVPAAPPLRLAESLLSRAATCAINIGGTPASSFLSRM